MFHIVSEATSDIHRTVSNGDMFVFKKGSSNYLKKKKKQNKR